MRNEDSRDPWMEQPGHSMAAWERSLRPAKSTSRIWLPIGIAAALGLACVAYLVFVEPGGWPGASQVRNPKERQAVPATPSGAREAPARQDARQRLEPDAAPRVQRFAKCISAAGAIAYSDGVCPSGTRAAEVAVNPDINLADGMSDAARQASMRNNSAIAQSVVEHERRVAMNVDSPNSACAGLKALVASIDAAARQPQSAYEQDRLKEQRRQANDKMFALRC